MKKYKQFSDGSITCKSSGMSFPTDKENRHYREFLNLQKQGLVEVEVIEDDEWVTIKSQVRSTLANTDWTQLPDNNLSAREKSAWRAYRQQVREITKTFNKPENVVWPSRP